jgi:N-acetylglucosaminyldiphosphoundecaprenol N-acetyl-beta-D-mannosaminyltransferase
MTGSELPRSCFQVLGVSVDAVRIDDVCAILEQWIRQRRRCHFVAVTGMHGVMEAQQDPSFRAVLNSADLVVPDGMPLVWLGRLRGLELRRRVYGPELMLAVCQQTTARGWRHFLLGGEPGVPDRLAAALKRMFPGLQIVGTYSPPFRPLTEGEDKELIAAINRTSPDVVWVGLSTPKQERWMFQHRDRLNAAVLLGVGAAFDIHSGSKRQAPKWMREGGFEWLFRLFQEPRRLWRRYLIYGPRFVFFAALELFGLWKFQR